jgi:hypothetical protein
VTKTILRKSQQNECPTANQLDASRLTAAIAQTMLSGANSVEKLIPQRDDGMGTVRKPPALRNLLPCELIGLADWRRVPQMGELLDALNAADSEAAPPAKSAMNQATELFRFASQKVDEAIDAAQAPGMPLDTISRWARQAPLQALAAAFLVGVMTARRRRR